MRNVIVEEKTALAAPIAKLNEGDVNKTPKHIRCK